MSVLPSFFKNIPEIELDKSKKRILLIYGLALLVVSVLYLYLFLRPSIAKLFGLIPRVQTRAMEIKAVRNDLLLEDTFKKRVKSLQESLGEYEKRLSREKEIPVLLESLSKMAKNSRVKLLGITPLDRALKKQKVGATGEERIYQEVPIVISAQSGYHELGAFISKLENDKRYMQISDIKIKTSRANPKRHVIEFVVRAYTFKGSE